MEMALKYGRGTRTLRIPDGSVRLAILTPGRVAPTADEPELLRAALAAPIDSPRLAHLARPGQRVAIVTSDVTRPCPSARLLPFLLEELTRSGVADDDITVVFGLGTHRGHTAAEREGLAGPAPFRRVRCIDSDPTDVMSVGTTPRGTPIEVFRPVLAADLRIAVGVIEYHYFAGYSGGVKALVPGVCSERTIQHNHRMMTEPGATTGNLDGNPVRDDIEDAGAMIGVHFILNVVLDEAHQVVAAVAGHPRTAHRAGCAKLDAFGRAALDRPADVVVVSAGGYPKDINLYQAQKALDNARLAVRPEGIVVLIAECTEGLGSGTFEAWMRDPGGPDAILARIRQQFVLGGHKAAAVALAMKQAAIYLVSAMPAAEARAMGFVPFSDPGAALTAALTAAGLRPWVAVMPEGGSVLPAVRTGGAAGPA